MATVTKSDSSVKSGDNKIADPQANANADKKSVGDGSDHAKDRGAEKGDVDEAKRQEEFAKNRDEDQDERGKDALDRRDEQVKEEKKVAEDRDKSQAEALKDAAEAKAQPAPEELRTLADTRSASDLVNKSWTVQSETPYYDVQSEPGQAFVTSQLPNREVQRAAGIDPDQQTAGLVVLDRDDATKNVVSGPEPWEARDLGLVK